MPARRQAFFVPLNFKKILDLVRFSQTSGHAAAVAGNLFSPSAGLAPIIYKDLGWAGLGMPATVLEALKVPAIYRGIALYAATISSVKPGAGAPAWLSEAVGSITPEGRLVSIVQDLIFFRESCLLVRRNGAGEILEGLRLPYEMWGLDPFGNVLVNGTLVDQSIVVYIPSLLPMGLLEAAADTIHHYLDLNHTIRSRGKNPVPLVELHITDDFEGTADELAKAQRDWSAARTAENGAVAFTPKGIELKTPGLNGADTGTMLIEARNAVRLDAANFLNINAALLEGANGASDNYSNTLQSKDELVSLSLATWLIPISARLSAPDVTSTPWEFETGALTAGPGAKGNLGTATEPGAQALEAPAPTTAGPSAADLLTLSNAAGGLIRSGFDPVETLASLGLANIKHLGMLPVTLQKPLDPDGTEDSALVDDLTKGENA